jgi:hypothetical protein
VCQCDELYRISRFARKKDVKLPLKQAMEAHKNVRCWGSPIFYAIASQYLEHGHKITQLNFKPQLSLNLKKWTQTACKRMWPFHSHVMVPKTTFWERWSIEPGDTVHGSLSVILCLNMISTECELLWCNIIFWHVCSSPYLRSVTYEYPQIRSRVASTLTPLSWFMFINYRLVGWLDLFYGC